MFPKGLTKIAVVIIISFSGNLAYAQLKNDHVPDSGSDRLKGFEEHSKMLKESLFVNYLWQFAGPRNLSGRMADIAVPKGNPHTIYAATAGGGLWKTVNDGVTWTPIFDDQACPAVGAVAVAPSNSDIVWVGTGEPGSSRVTYSGTGVYQSTDAGKTWRHRGLEDSYEVGRIIIHPDNPDIVYVAALGSHFTYNRQRGVYKTTNGGITWEEVLFINERTGVADLAMDPSNPDVLYAAAFERFRRPWHMWYCGPGSGIYRTIDGGRNWEALTNGFPHKGLEGRIGIAVAPSDPNVVYASIDNQDIYRKAKPGEKDAYGFKMNDVIKGFELYRSDNRGESWKKVNKEHMPFMHNTYGYLFSELVVHPEDKNTVWVLGIPLMKSTDGGESFTIMPETGSLHADHHALWIDPEDPEHMISGNDGGVYISYDGGRNWRLCEGLPTSQFYSVSVDRAEPFNIYGSVQDFNCFMGSSADGQEYDWRIIPGGETSYIVPDPSNPGYIYSTDIYGTAFSRSNVTTLESVNIRVKPAGEEKKLRNTWLTPFIVSPHNPYTLYYGSQYLHRSVNRGETWFSISPDLTDDDEQCRGNVPFGTITTISESPIIPGMIWVGTDDGNVRITVNGGADWMKIDGLDDKWVSRVEASRFHECTAYVSLNGYRDHDCAVYLYKVSGYGKKIENIGSNIPLGPVNVIREDPKNENVLYVGTDTGLYISTDGGKIWHAFQRGLPASVIVHDLVMQPRDNILVAGTHGRGVFTIDAAPVQQLTKKIKAKNLHVFKCKTVKVPVGIYQTYYLKPQALVAYYSKNAGNVKIEIVDKEEKSVWQKDHTGEKGLNSVWWNLKPDKTSEYRDKSGSEFVPSGLYTVRVSSGRYISETTIEVK